MNYEAWRATHQDAEAAAKAAYKAFAQMQDENRALRKYVDGLRAALGAQVRFSVEEFEKQGMRVVNAGALQMVVSALRRDAEEGKVVRGEMADELLATSVRAQADAQDIDRWMGIGKAIERACADLPDGTEISVSLEKDAGTVTMIDQDGNEHENFCTDYGFAGVLNEAIDAAIADQAKQGGAT